MSTLAATAPVWAPHAFFFGPLLFLIPIFWIVVIVLIVSLVGRRRFRMMHAMGYGPWGAASRGAESTLAERFAQGDIDEVEYRARLEVLRANRQGPMR